MIDEAGLTMFRVCVLIIFGIVNYVLCKRYQPNWESIDSRPLPPWYDEAKIGIFVTWGVYSVPSVQSEWFWYYWKAVKTRETTEYMNQNFKPDFTYQDFAFDFTAEFYDPGQWAELFNASGASVQSEWFWYYWKAVKTRETTEFMKQNFKPDFTYQDFAVDFTAEFYDPGQWADLFNASGARYIVFTTKHHEGFTNWPSKYAFSWNSMDVGPHRDLVGELAHAIRTKTPHIHLGLYHSLFEWFNPLYLQDEANNWTTNEFVRRKTMPELYEIVNAYKPEVVWSDAPMMARDVYWNSTEFIAWLYNDSPVKDTVVTNDRWGHGILCHHGGFMTCHDKYNPGVLQKRKWESGMTLDKMSWGYRRQMTLSDVMSMKDVIKTVVEVVSCGGNILINVGPTKDGRIVPIFEERLRSLGQWLGVNGEAIYGTSPWRYQNDTSTQGVWYTLKPDKDGGVVYALVLNWPDDSQNLTLMSPKPQAQTEVTMLGYPHPIQWEAATPGQGIMLIMPTIPFNQMPCDYAWVFRMTHLA